MPLHYLKPVPFRRDIISAKDHMPGRRPSLCAWESELWARQDDRRDTTFSSLYGGIATQGNNSRGPKPSRGLPCCFWATIQLAFLCTAVSWNSTETPTEMTDNQEVGTNTDSRIFCLSCFKQNPWQVSRTFTYCASPSKGNLYKDSSGYRSKGDGAIQGLLRQTLQTPTPKEAEWARSMGSWNSEFPYDGYLPIKLTFDSSMTGTFDTLDFVCPRVPGATKSSLIIGSNTDLVKRLFNPLQIRKIITNV